LVKKSNDGHAISRQEKRRFPEQHSAISRQEKMAFSTLGLPSSSSGGARTPTSKPKFFWIDMLPDLFTHGAPRTPLIS